MFTKYAKSEKKGKGEASSSLPVDTHLITDALQKISNNDPKFGNEELRKFLTSQDFCLMFNSSKDIKNFQNELILALKKNYVITYIDLRIKIKIKGALLGNSLGEMLHSDIIGLIDGHLSAVFLDHIHFSSNNDSIEIPRVSAIIEALQDNFSITTFHFEFERHLFNERAKRLTDRNTKLQKDFFTAVKEDCVEDVRIILTHTYNQALFFKDPADKMNTALHMAVELGYVNLTKFLMVKMNQHDIPLDIRNAAGKTPTDLASTEEILSIFKSDSEAVRGRGLGI